MSVSDSFEPCVLELGLHLKPAGQWVQRTRTEEHWTNPRGNSLGLLPQTFSLSIQDICSISTLQVTQP